MSYIPNAQYTNLILDAFVNNVLADGGTVNEAQIRNEYLDLHTTIKKQASLVVCGGAYKVGRVYGFNPQTSALIPFTFTRAGAGGTRVNRSGLIESMAADTPRMDHDALTGQFKGLLMERSSTNILPNSYDFMTPAFWTTNTSGLTLSTTADTIFPHGYRTKVVVNATNSAHSFATINTTGLTASSVYSFTVHLKNTGTQRYVLVRFNDGASNANAVSCVVDLLNSVIVSTTAYGLFTAPVSTLTVKNGYVSVSTSANIGAGVTSAIVKISAMSGPAALDVNGQATFFLGNGTDNFELYATQFEAGQPTSYIPTNGATVTRAADECSVSVGAWYSTAAGSIYAQAAQPIDVGVNSRSVVSLTFDAGNRITAYRQTGSRVANTWIAPPGAAIGNGIPTTTGQYWKQAAAITSAVDCVGASFGTLYGPQATTLGLATLTKLFIGNYNTGANENLDGWVKCAAYFNTRLANTDLQAITL